MKRTPYQAVPFAAAAVILLGSAAAVPFGWTSEASAQTKPVTHRFDFGPAPAEGYTVVSRSPRPSVSARQEPGRRFLSMNPDWRVLVGDPAGARDPGFDDSGWKRVSLPYAWNEDSAFRVDIHELPTGIAWYRKSFTLPEGATDGKVFLEFEGVRQAAEVYLNGELIGRHENGVMAFGFDITGLAHPAPAENVLAVRTDNDWDYAERATGQRFQWADRNFNANYGGITKNVRLHLTDRLYQTLPLYSWLGTTGVYVYAQDIDVGAGTARITAESQVRNEHSRARTLRYAVEVRDLDGTLVAAFEGEERTIPPGATITVEASAAVESLRFWSWGYGALYDVATGVVVDGEVVDEVVTRTGFRKTAFRDGMVQLNDRVLHIKGYAQRSTNEWPAIGGSVPAWLSDFSNGLMVESNANTVRWMHITPWKQDVESADRVGLIQIMPAGDSEGDVEGRRWEQRVELMRDAIIYNRNNPSILFYEGGNEAISEEHMAELVALRDRYDPHGGRAMGSREMLDSEVAEWGGEMLYVNKSGDIPLFATEYNRNEGLRRYWDEDSPPFHVEGSGEGVGPSYNMNQDSFAVEDVVRWYEYWRERPGTGPRVSAGGLNIIFTDTNTHFRGEENYRRSGEADPMRIPKDAFFAHQAMWDGWVAIEKPRATILGHWNYPAGTVKDVTAVSSARDVELFLDGRSLGRGERSHRFLFTFQDVAWQPGTLRAVGYDADGEPVCEAEIETVADATRLELTPMTDPTGWRADGHDLALVQVEAVDAEGRRHPLAFHDVQFQLEGPAAWRGGIAKGPDNYILSRTLPLELGVNRVLVRSTLDPGTVRLTARARGLEPATVELATRPIELVGGLTPYLPGDGLPARLDRGPTPAGSSLEPATRRALAIAGVDAGSNVSAAEHAVDDNELSSWASDSIAENAWIRLDLAEPEPISQVKLKVASHRTTSYPILIAIDGREVWRGSVGRTLTYDTIELEPTDGRSVTIALEGVTQVQDPFGDLIEVTGVRDQSGEEDVRDRLDILEIELYTETDTRSNGS